jgi:predicted nuclease of restriction endonuclease-like (RecB) superfamily
MKKSELALYGNLLGEIKIRVRQAQQRAALSANSEMLMLYWDVGRMIAARQKSEGWGKGLLARLAIDLRNEISDMKGFSERNLQLMVQFQDEYPDLFSIPQLPVAELPAPDAVSKIEPPAVAQLPKLPAGDLSPSSITQRAVAELSWAHNVILIQKLKHLPTRIWYARQASQQGWSRDTLTIQIKNRAHERQGTAVTNFAATLPEVHATLAQGLLEDSYLFDFLTLEEPFHERDPRSTPHLPGILQRKASGGDVVSLSRRRPQ